MSGILVFFPTYNEAGNVRPLIGAIRRELPSADVLVVDDASSDGTGSILDGIAAAEPRVRVVHRPRKMGVGTAHKLAMMHARDHGYDLLVTMDADFSHHPRYLPRMVKLLADNDFVTGSRYVAGGRLDYGLARTLLSRSANLVAKLALGMPLEENTTLFRGFRRALLERLDIAGIRSEGYSFAVESLYRIGRITTHLAEFPIHFEDRFHGASKISRVEIVRGVLTVARLLVARLLRRSASAGDPSLSADGTPCGGCGLRYAVQVHPAREPDRPGATSAYDCATLERRSHGRILQCLACGLVFSPPRLGSEALLRAYRDVEDPTYLEHIAARRATFRYNMRSLLPYLEPSHRVLEVGCYCGAFLEVAGEHEVEVVGLEPSRWAARIARERQSAPVFEGTLAELPEEAGVFDAVVAWDVLEHFAEPGRELRYMNRRLDVGGLLAFSTLMIDNWFPRLAGRHWPWFMDMHLYYFTEETLSDMLAETGFVIVDSRPYCHVVTLSYLLLKLATLGVPLAARLGSLLSGRPLGELLLPFRIGDIKLFVCRKSSDVDAF